MSALALRTAVLWIHALAGAGWIVASAALLIVAATAGTREAEGIEILRRTAPVVNRIGFAAIATILVTGIANVFSAGAERGYRFSPQFLAVLGAKVAVFVAMFAVLAASMRTESRMHQIETDAALTRRLLIFNGLVAALGAIALGLGLWLMGS